MNREKLELKIREDSRKVNKGDTFIALRKVHDGHDYVEQAIKNGATKVIVEEGNFNVETVKVEDTRKYLIDYLYNTYYDKLRQIKLIGMTGTNGKTTTCYLIYQALNKLNIKCAYIGTIGFYMENKVRDLPNTTPDILDIYDMLIECYNQGYEYVVMECSSQALDMHRLDKLEFKYGLFSNLTPEHLDYHKTLENYALAKQKLFNQVTDKTFVNADDEYKKYFIKDNTITYGLNGELKISNIKMNLQGSTFDINGETFNTKLLGMHNIYNMTCVIAILKELNLNTNVVKELTAPPGRMDIINKNDNIIVIDYAHTPDAVEKILDTISALNHNKIYTIIGCGGNRDKTKRPVMGKISCTKSDFVIFTNDNPRFEDQTEIMNDITKDLEYKNYKVVFDREEAIKEGLKMLSKNDILMILGKGHEKYQIIGDEKIHCDDKEIVQNNI